MNCPKCKSPHARYVVKNDTNRKTRKDREDFTATCKCGWSGSI